MAVVTFPFAKDPSEKLDYSFDFGPLVGDAAIQSQTVTCSDNALVITNVALTDKVVSANVAGGLVADPETSSTGKYTLSFRVVLVDGRNFERSVVLKIAER